MAHLDDLSITTIGGCAVAPVVATRSLWKGTRNVEGIPTALYEDGETYSAEIELTDIRSAGVCDAAGVVEIIETAPNGWEFDSVSGGGEIIADNVARWQIELTGAEEIDLEPISYTVIAFGEGRAEFQGELSEEGSGFTFAIAGPRVAFSDAAIPEISDFGSIQHWLILGPFTREVDGAAPGEEEIVRDYLTDGDVFEEDVTPVAGDTIEPDYGGEAASTGLASSATGRNPGDVPTWVEWIDRDDADDRIDFESVYGEQNEVLCYGFTYLIVEEDIEVNFGVSSDDAVHILLDGDTLHANNVARGATDRAYQDLPTEFESLGNVELSEGVHTILVKVFEGGGDHNFRLGFVDEFGLEIPGGPDGVTIALSEPECDDCPTDPDFKRGDTDESGVVELTDGIRTLNFLFTGGPAPVCGDAADTDDNGAIQLTDAIGTFGFLFLGANEPPAPGATVCGQDTTEDGLVCITYAGCP